MKLMRKWMSALNAPILTMTASGLAASGEEIGVTVGSALGFLAFAKSSYITNINTNEKKEIHSEVNEKT